MASNNFINECQNYANCNRLGELKFRDDLKINKLVGNTTQASTPTPSSPVTIKTATGTNNVRIHGKNLYDYTNTNSLTNGWSIGEDGWQELECVNDTSSSKWNNYFTKKMNLTPNKEYKIVVEVKEAQNIGSITLVQGRSDEQFATATNINPLSVGTFIRTSTCKADYSSASNGLRMFVSTPANKTSKLKIRISIIDDSTVTPENYVYEKYISKLHALNLGSTELCDLGDYEDVIFPTTGKNILPNNHASRTHQDVTFAPQEDGTYLITGINTTSTNAIVYIHQGDFSLPIGTYYGIATGNGNITVTMYVKYTDDTREYIDITTTNTISKEVKYADIYIQVKKNSNTQFTNYKVYPILSKTSVTKQDYEPYNSFNEWYIRKSINKLVINGTETISAVNTSSTDTTRVSYNHFADDSTDLVIISNRLEQKNNWSWDKEGISYDSSNGGFWFRINKSTIGETESSVNTWLTSNNIISYFPLKNPTYTKVTGELLTQIEGLVNDVGCYGGETTVFSASTNAPLVIDSTITDGAILNQDNYIQEFSIDSGCYVDGKIIGTNYAKKLETKLLASASLDLENKPLLAKVAVRYTGGTLEGLDLGKFTVEKPTDDQIENTSSIVAYDDLINHLDDEYTTNLDYESGTITLGDVYEELCGHLELTPKTTTFTNSTIVVSANPFTNGEKNREVLKSIEKVSCTFTVIDNENNTIDLVWLSDTLDYTFNKDDYSSLEGGKTVYGPINSLVIKNSQIDDENVSISDEQSIAANGEHQLVIAEDYFLYNETLREAAINGIWAKVNGLTYVDCKITTYTGKPFLNIGDKIRVYTDTNEYFDTYVLKHTFTYDGSFKSVIESPCLTEQEVKTKQDITLQDKLRNTQIVVDKANASISQIVEAVGDDGEVTSASIVTAINNDTSSIKLEADKIDINGVVSANNNFKIKQDGSVEVNNGTIDLIDNGTSETIPKIKVASRDSVVTNEIYSYGMQINNTYGQKIDVTTSGYYSEHTISGNSKNKITIDEFGRIVMQDTDINGNVTNWAYLGAGTDLQNAFELGYGNDTNFEIHNEQNYCYQKTKGAIVATDSNDNQTFVVDGANGNITTAGKIIIPQNSVFGIRNSSDIPILRDWNGAVTLDGGGGDLYVGHQYTQNINFLDGKMYLMSNGSVTLNGEATLNANMKFQSTYIKSINLDDIGSWNNAYSQEVALHNPTGGSVINAPGTDEVAILKCYCWSGNGDWAVQEWFGINTFRKFIRVRQNSVWTGWRQLT